MVGKLSAPPCAWHTEADLTALLIAPGSCLLLVALSSSSDRAQAAPVHQEKGVTDAAPLGHDERYESEEVGRKLALRSGAQGASSWMGLKEKEGGSLRKIISLIPALFFLPNSDRNMPRYRGVGSENQRAIYRHVLSASSATHAVPDLS